VREYALEKLAAGGKLNRLLQDHAAYYRALVATVEAQLGLNPNEAENWLQLLEEENDNLLAALADGQPLETNQKYTSHVEVGTFINRPVEDVFVFTTDLEKMPIWSTGTQNVPVLEGGMKQGAEVKTISNVLGRQVQVRVKVTELEPPRRAVAQSIGGPVTFHILLTCDPVGDGTLLKFAADVESSALFRIVAPVFQPIFRRELEKAVGVLKQILESGDA
jgi:carbon monoxide dehydrogenase subunit G